MLEALRRQSMDYQNLDKILKMSSDEVKANAIRTLMEDIKLANDQVMEMLEKLSQYPRQE